MKKILFLIISLLINAMSYAYDFKDGDFYYTITSLSDLTVALTNSGEIVQGEYSWETNYAPCYGGDFTVPKSAEYAGKIFTVTSIESNAFSGCTFTRLTIPENILSARISANSIDFLMVEDSEMPLSEFSASAKEVYIGRNISAYWSYSFANSNVEKVTFGDKVTYVSRTEFSECSKLAEVILGNNITHIYNQAFTDCTNLKKISGTGVEYIEGHAFTNCKSLESFDFPNLMTIDDGDSQWGTYRWGVFQGCTSLKKVILPEGLTKIGTMAFMDCSLLEEVYIPGTIETLGYGYDNYGYVFANCNNLKKISVAAQNPIYLSESIFDAQTYINATLNVPVGAKEKYLSAVGWSNFFNINEDPSLVSTICVINVRYDDYYGKVECDGKLITSGEKIKVSIGDPLTLSFIPNDGYTLSEVSVNDSDWTNKVDKNQLTIPSVESNANIYVSFERIPIYLTIKQAENGNIKIKTSRGREYQLVIEPAVGWTIHSVTFNGEDVTSEVSETGKYNTPEIYENSELVVAFEESVDGIAYQYQSKAKVSASSGTITVKDAANTELISIYNDSGILIEHAKGNGSLQTFTVPTSQVYIVKVGDKTVKIGL